MKIDIKERDNAFTLSDEVRELMNTKDNKKEPIYTEEYVDNLRTEYAIGLFKYTYLLLALAFMYVVGDSYLNTDDGYIQILLSIGTILFAYISYKILKM